MCGIAGIMMRDGQVADSGTLKKMAAALVHRGPDGAGIFCHGTVGLLNTRLAIVDIDHGQQPFIADDGTVLVANGEIYNDPDIRESLPQAGFKSGSDCESALHLYEKYGLGFTRHLRGMYALALFDARKQALVLARDPYGIKQLYYVMTPAFFAFASEPQALIAAGLAGRSLVPRVRAEMLQLQFTTGTTTVFADIQRLLPGETLVIDNAAIVHQERRRPHTRRATRPVPLSYETAYRQLDQHLQDSVRLHMRSDAPVGLFLSGGIDSSALLTVMSRLDSRPVVALTATFPGAGSKNERSVAEALARGAGADHHCVDMAAADFFNHAPHLASALDDPTADSSALPLFLLARAARKDGLKVVLSGDGADELFGGYRRYRRAAWFFGLWRQKTRTRGVFSSLMPADSLPAWRTGLAQSEKAESVPAISAMQTLQAIDCAEWLPNNLLLKLDRCLMAHGIEGRTPFLDPVLSPFAYDLPETLKVRNGLGKWLLRDWVARNAPGSDPWSKKQGFIPPVGQWIDQYKSRIEPLLLNHPAIAELSLQAAVRRIYAAPLRHPQAAWSLLFYTLWHNRHVLGVTARGSIDEVLDAARLAA
ncbi:asparagine synthase (glutamine-hydrolyzing) [Asticcacaulis sp. EMRT-3]|nr:asparagine synthase (glutamine-hydrolyzing) [Asticcacaulis sp. EMRT-3]MDI7776271.1 asparagine synthase (glutamine-hydrolyzing) [Asticcacaulis sp. EMRT-3]